MIKLKNIKIDGIFVTCDIYPEDSVYSGYMIINTESNKIEEYLLPNGFEYCKNHVEHAKSFIVKHLRDIVSIPITEKTIMWY